MKKEIYVAIVGKPNVGKSTLFNTCTGANNAIVTHKPQTTRDSHTGTHQSEKFCCYFIDTPGYHQQRNKLDQFLNSQVKKGLQAAHLILFLIDSTRHIDNEDKKIRQLLKNFNIENFLVVFSKADVVEINHIPEIYKQLEIKPETPYLCLNCQDKSSINILMDKIAICCQDNLEADGQIQQFFKDDSWIVKETIRQQALLLLKQEIPYGVAVEIKSSNYDQKKNFFSVEADLIVEKESHKPIVVGKQGKTIKAIGTKARMVLLDIYDCQICLKLFVRVEKDWRNNQTLLKQLGYGQN